MTIAILILALLLLAHAWLDDLQTRQQRERWDAENPLFDMPIDTPEARREYAAWLAGVAVYAFSHNEEMTRLAKQFAECNSVGGVGATLHVKGTAPTGPRE